MNQIVLVGQGGNALYPFPCSVTIQKRAEVEDDKNVGCYCIVCGGDTIMAKYREMVPAKLEVLRLKDAWERRDNGRPDIFEFVKDVQ